MATKAETLLAAVNDEGCLGKAADDEVVFVLRARDLLAAPLVKLWAALAMQNGCDMAKCEEAVKIADDMEDWAAANGGHFPD